MDKERIESRLSAEAKQQIDYAADFQGYDYRRGAPTDEELANGIRDPLGFYTQYGFAPFPGAERRLLKRPPLH